MGVFKTALVGSKRLYPLPLPNELTLHQHVSKKRKPNISKNTIPDFNPVKKPNTESVSSKKKKKKKLDSNPVKKPDIEQVSKKKKLDFNPVKKLPDSWLRCPPYGEAIDRIIPSKVPLSEAFNSLVEPDRQYPLTKFPSPGTEIGLVIDLTNCNNQYYKPSQCVKKGIKHVKIAVKKDYVPDNESVNKFVFEVSKFMTEEISNSKYILVHSVHGYNDTGFMIVHHLMRSFSVSLTSALQIFAKARSPGIFKQKYINELYSFYHEDRPQTVICPSTPEWKRRKYILDLNVAPKEEEEEDEEDQDCDDGNDNNQSEVIQAMRDEDVLGDAISQEEQEVLRKSCYKLLNLGLDTKGNLQFPGQQAVSLTRKNIELLRKRHFYATWKAIGTRYMMLIRWDGCYLIDENFQFRRVQMRFPLRQSSIETHNLTLLDGEMVIDTLPDGNNQERRYLVYDVMAINKVCIVDLPFHERWNMLEKQIVEPRNMDRRFIQNSSYPNYRYDMEPFRVRRKEFWPISTTPKLLTGFIPKLSHPANGLVFQGWDDQYVPSKHGGLLNWENGHAHTVRFLIQIDKEGQKQLLFLLEGGKKKLMEGEKVMFHSDSDPAENSGKVIECTWVSKNVWAHLPEKTDITIPNSIGKYFKVIERTQNIITKNVFMNEITEIVCLPIYKDKSSKLKSE